MSGDIIITGAREHNLKDISLRLPRDRFIVITGLSGSGKTSLAFDTIYAEGQRRYVESLSAYARQFLGQMDKPDVDSIEGLSPAISIDQRTTSRNPRSTVGTVTEIYDYLRLLYARVGHPHCPDCGRPIEGQIVQQIVDQVCELEAGTRFSVVAPLVRGRKGEYGKLLKQVRADGFSRVKVDGHVRELDEEVDARQAVQARHRGGRRPAGDEGRPATAAHRLRRDRRRALRGPRRDRARRRAHAHLLGEVRLRPLRHLAARDPAARLQLQQPARRLPGVPRPGLGTRDRPRPGRAGRSVSIDRERCSRTRACRSAFLEQAIDSIAEKFGVDRSKPWRELPEEQRDLFLYGTGSERIHLSYRNYEGRMRHYTAAFHGIVANLQRRYRRPSRTRCARRSRSTWPSARARSATGRG